MKYIFNWWTFTILVVVLLIKFGHDLEQEHLQNIERRDRIEELAKDCENQDRTVVYIDRKYYCFDKSVVFPLEGNKP